ncbi:MAG TPA: oxygenase MpaB family protein [Actinomycetota bacterium]|nr:oxygenase MpaB family protein [Actinomycetota bacterium]
MNRMVELVARAGLPLPPLEVGTAGDPGLFGPNSSFWRIGRERVLLLGGPAALLLQVAHPLIAAGVADQSDFRHHPYQRLTATLDATLTISFGDRRQAEAAAARVAATHARVRGTLRTTVGPVAEGTPYDAADPELALWVHATLVETGLDTYHRFVQPLTEVQRGRYFQDARSFGALFAVGDDVMPASYEAFRRYVESMKRGRALAVGPDAKELARHILNPPVPGPLTPVSRLARLLAASLLPPQLRTAFGLTWTRREAAVLRAAAASVRLTLPLTPPSVRYWPHYRSARRRTDARKLGG